MQQNRPRNMPLQGIHVLDFSIMLAGRIVRGYFPVSAPGDQDRTARRRRRYSVADPLRDGAYFRPAQRREGEARTGRAPPLRLSAPPLLLKRDGYVINHKKLFRL